jgi:hypothetical protein
MFYFFLTPVTWSRSMIQSVVMTDERMTTYASSDKQSMYETRNGTEY